MKRIYLHPLPLRICHWVNALIVILLLVTGIELRLPGVATLPANSTALLVHRYLGWAMTVFSVFWIVYVSKSGNLRRHYGIGKQDFEGIYRQAEFYLFSIFKGKENPFRPSPDEKFNPLQKLAYGAIMFVFTPLILVTGLLFSNILPFRKYILLFNAVKGIDATHVIVAYVFALYLVIHIYMSTLGRNTLSHIKAMVVGYEEEPDKPQIIADNKERPDAPDVDLSDPIAATALVFPENDAACQERPGGQEGGKDHG
jgi:thiosulfate reductase cytochrome b subunit